MDSLSFTRPDTLLPKNIQNLRILIHFVYLEILNMNVFLAQVPLK
jgi:hypothetical protein